MAQDNGHEFHADVEQLLDALAEAVAEIRRTIEARDQLTEGESAA